MGSTAVALGGAIRMCSPEASPHPRVIDHLVDRDGRVSFVRDVTDP
jgi:hypothetical protein